MQTCAVVVAAGAGRRFGAPKQFLDLCGRPVVHHAVTTAGEACDDVVVVIPAGVVWEGPDTTAAVAGGPTRSDSVRAGLAAVPEPAEIVVIHDAARPLASRELFDAVISAIERGADGAVPALAVSDTLKRVAGDGVVETVDRADLVAVQTPQAFRAERLREAHASGGDATDDAALVEAAGGRVVVVDGDPHNLKLTTATDLRIAGMLLEGDGQ